MTTKAPPHPTPTAANRERPVSAGSGWFMLFLTLTLYASVVGLWVMPGFRESPEFSAALSFVLFVAASFLSGGFLTLQPNEAAVLILFGEYRGTVRQSGLLWANPFLKKVKISLRARNFTGEKLKVNDKRGNPIEIAAVVVWHVRDTAQAKFDVDDYEAFVKVQSESAVRHLASQHCYDDADDGDFTLRAGGEPLTMALRQELDTRLAKAGVSVDDARLTHLAYAPEIAQAMLRRQQAEAVISARQKIVHGAVSMVDMALRELAEKQVVKLDDERKAAMVANLLVVLCSEAEVHPVINTGSGSH